VAAPQVRGLAQVKRAFKAAPDVVKKHLGEVNQTTANAIAAGARAKVAVRFGFLKGRITTTYSKATGLARVGVASGRIAVPGRKGSALTSQGAMVTDPSKYARFVEYGTSRVAARPFMSPAVKAQQQPHLDRIRQRRAEIEREMQAAGGTGD
jgi:HK97 gp10 family phage protein